MRTKSSCFGGRPVSGGSCPEAVQGGVNDAMDYYRNRGSKGEGFLGNLAVFQIDIFVA